MAFPLPMRLSAAEEKAILLLLVPSMRAMVEPVPSVSVEPRVSVLAVPGFSVPLTVAAPLMVPDPPRVAPVFTVTALPALVEPLTRRVPALTSVLPV